MSAGQKLRLRCTSCSTLCEVQIPVLIHKSARVRFQIKCPKCHSLNELRTGQQDASAGQKRKASEEGENGTNSKKNATAKSLTGGGPLASAAAPASATSRPGKAATTSSASTAAAAEATGAPTDRSVGGKARAGPAASKSPGRANGAAAESGDDDRSGGSGKAGGGKNAGAKPASSASAASAAASATAKSGVASKGRGARGGGSKSPRPGASNGSGGGGSAGGGGGGGTSAEMLDDFVIEEAAERLPVRPRARRQGGAGRLTIVGAKVAPWTTSPFERAFPLLPVSAPLSCEQAYQLAPSKPRWQINDEVEVAFKGKGYEGSWARGTVVVLDGRNYVLVRYFEFVDNDGSPLVERMGVERLRLPQPETSPAGWVPALGELVEGLWNDCWWEGSVREFHHTKGLLFQYDRWHSNWLWLPLRCARPRPPLSLYYPPPRPATADGGGPGDDGPDEDERPPPGVCGAQGCMLPNNHIGLCQARRPPVAPGCHLPATPLGCRAPVASTEPSSARRTHAPHPCTRTQPECMRARAHALSRPQVRISGSRRDAVRQRTEMALQEQLWRDIQLSKESRDQVAIARADALKKAEDEGATIRAPRGNRSQWHANFRVRASALLQP